MTGPLYITSGAATMTDQGIRLPAYSGVVRSEFSADVWCLQCARQPMRFVRNAFEGDERMTVVRCEKCGNEVSLSCSITVARYGHAHDLT